MGCTKINNVWIFCTKKRHTSLQRYLLRRQERITYEVVVGEKSSTQSHRTNPHIHKHTLAQTHSLLRYKSYALWSPSP